MTLHGNLLYVLNAGGEGNITGFRIGKTGELKPMEAFTRSLNVAGDNPPFFLVSPSQVSFDPRGNFLLVTVKGSNEIHAYSVNQKGLSSKEPVTTLSEGNTPFSFSFDRNNHVLVAEAFGAGNVGDGNASAVSSYNLNLDGSLCPIASSVPNG